MLRYRHTLFRHSQTCQGSDDASLQTGTFSLLRDSQQPPITTHQLFHRLENQLVSSIQTHNTATHALTDHLHHTSSFLQLPLSIILKTRIYVHHKHQHHFLCGSRCSLSAGASLGGTSCGCWWGCRVGGVVRIDCRAAPVRNAYPPLILQKCPALV